MGNKELVELLPSELQFVLVVAFNGLLVCDGVFLGAQERFERHHGWLSFDIGVAEVAGNLSTITKTHIVNS